MKEVLVFGIVLSSQRSETESNSRIEESTAEQFNSSLHRYSLTLEKN